MIVRDVKLSFIEDKTVFFFSKHSAICKRSRSVVIDGFEFFNYFSFSSTCIMNTGSKVIALRVERKLNCCNKLFEFNNDNSAIVLAIFIL